MKFDLSYKSVLTSALLAGSIIVASTASSEAAVIYSDFGPDLAYASTGAWALSGNNELSMQFTSTGDYSVTQIDLALGYAYGPNGVTVQLRADNAGLPGTVLDSWNLTGLVSGVGSVQTISGISGIQIAAGSYWLDAYALGFDENTYVDWRYNSIAASGTVCGLSPTYCVDSLILGAFDVIGTSTTPLPAALPLFATGLGALGLFGWRRKRKAAAIAA